MSATLTPKRKSARDRPASSIENELGERKREIDRGARGLKTRVQSSPCSRSPKGSAGL